MNEFFSWAVLGTYAGATLATTLITQALKGLRFIEKLPTRVFSYLVALIVLLAAGFFSGGFTLSAAGLCFINAVVVSLAANGAFEMAATGANKSKEDISGEL